MGGPRDSDAGELPRKKVTDFPRGSGEDRLACLFPWVTETVQPARFSRQSINCFTAVKNTRDT